MFRSWRAMLKTFETASMSRKKVFSTFSITILLFVAAAAAAQPAEKRGLCRPTGERCFLGIDPDVYQMPLFGESIQSDDRSHAPLLVSHDAE